MPEAISGSGRQTSAEDRPRRGSPPEDHWPHRVGGCPAPADRGLRRHRVVRLRSCHRLPSTGVEGPITATGLLQLSGPHPFTSSPSSPSIAPPTQNLRDSSSSTRHRPALAVATRPHLPPANIPGSYWPIRRGRGFGGAGLGGASPAAAGALPPGCERSRRSSR